MAMKDIICEFVLGGQRAFGSRGWPTMLIHVTQVNQITEVWDSK